MTWSVTLANEYHRALSACLGTTQDMVLCKGTQHMGMSGHSEGLLLGSIWGRAGRRVNELVTSYLLSWMFLSWIFAVILFCPAISQPNLRPPISRPGPTFHGDVPFVLLQLFEELQGLLTQKAEDRESLQAPGLHRRAGSKAQGEGLPGAVCGGHMAQPSGAGVAWLSVFSMV